ncbi:MULTISPECIES: hypothetical protein [unclassified Anabaena]|uniref:hypothetical protein n=1 Tax=unclassified Anabaena TaxID=2619674 RepID=UPI0039C5DE58
MNTLSNQLSITFQFSIYLLGLVSLGNVLVTPVNAQQATVRGAASLVRTSGTFINVSGELALPAGAYSQSVQIAPIYGGTPGGLDETITGLTITPGGMEFTASSSTNPFVDATANLLNSGLSLDNLDNVVTIIRAGGGEQGLGALE